jgi:hypothetical protein
MNEEIFNIPTVEISGTPPCGLRFGAGGVIWAGLFTSWFAAICEISLNAGTFLL